MLSDIFARTPQSPSEPNTPRSQQSPSIGQPDFPDKFPPTHLSMET